MSEAYNIPESNEMAPQKEVQHPEFAENPEPRETIDVYSLRSKLILGEWATRAACAGMDTNDFFPAEQRNSRANKEIVADAKKVCGRCPVREECLDYVLVNDREMLGGIFGGYTQDERRKLLNLRQRFRQPRLQEGN